MAINQCFSTSLFQLKLDYSKEPTAKGKIVLWCSRYHFCLTKSNRVLTLVL